EEGGFVAGAAGGVEDGLVRIIQRIQVACDQRESRVPADGAVTVRVRVVDQRMRQAPLVLEPEVALLRELTDGVPLEQFRSRTACGGFGGHGLHAVLAELECGSMVTVG